MEKIKPMGGLVYKTTINELFRTGLILIVYEYVFLNHFISYLKAEFLENNIEV